MIPWLARRWPWAGAALLALAIAARVWWQRLTSRALAAERARADRAELERDAAGGRAAVAEAQADVAADHATRTAAGAAAAEEFPRHVPSDLAPADRVRALDDVARRLHAEDDSRAGAGSDRATPVRDPAAPGG